VRLAGGCRIVSFSFGLLQTSVSDCRVLDSDGDGSPGVTIQFSGARGGQDYVRFRDQRQLAEGNLDPHGRHTGLWLENNDYYQLQCASGLCTRTAYRVCKPEIPRCSLRSPMPLRMVERGAASRCCSWSMLENCFPTTCSLSPMSAEAQVAVTLANGLRVFAPARGVGGLKFIYAEIFDERCYEQ
jgi:hypothetical protein